MGGNTFIRIEVGNNKHITLMETRPDNFINVEYNVSTLDIYHARKSILTAIESNLKNFSGSLLDVGCGKMPYREFIMQNSSVNKYTGLDLDVALLYDTNVKPDVIWDGVDMPFNDATFNVAIATEVLEHCPDPYIILKETHRVLKIGGCLFFTVPFVWNLHETPHDEYRYTPFSLKRILTESGFNKINIQATGGWHASMAQMLGLWVRRAPMTAWKRKMLSTILKPIIKKLIATDKHAMIAFTEGTMMPGLYGTAYKL